MQCTLKGDVSNTGNQRPEESLQETDDGIWAELEAALGWEWGLPQVEKLRQMWEMEHWE